MLHLYYIAMVSGSGTTMQRRRRTRLEVVTSSILLSAVLVSTGFGFAPPSVLVATTTNARQYLLQAAIKKKKNQAATNNKNDASETTSSSVFQLPFGVPTLDKKRRIVSKNNNVSGSFFWASSFDSAAIVKELQSKVAEPLEEVLDGLTGGWALSYADLSPDSTSTPVGQGFLITNAAYFAAGILVFLQGDAWLGFWTDVAAIASFNYHYNQLVASEGASTIKKNQAVRLALLLDYTAAAISMLTATLYLTSGVVPVEGLIAAALGLGFLYMSWVYEYGRPYMFWHSLWHLCSAYAGYVIGISHATTLV
jgi:hypothetical protein